jgi:hypothetical protein
MRIRQSAIALALVRVHGGREVAEALVNSASLTLRVPLSDCGAGWPARSPSLHARPETTSGRISRSRGLSASGRRRRLPKSIQYDGTAW